METQRQGDFRCGRRQLRLFRLVGKRWTLAILAALMHGPARFSEIGRAVPGLSERVMSERLQELCEAGLVRRHADAGTSAATWYQVTALGEHLRPAVESLLQAAAALPE